MSSGIRKLSPYQVFVRVCFLFEIGWFSWLVDMECILNIIRALWMGCSWSVDGSGTHPNSPSLSPGTQKSRRNSRRTQGWMTSADAKREELLKKTTGRMYLNGASSVASMFTQQGKKGTNQDAMIVWESFGSRSDTVFCGVFDGHGPYGHMVAKRVRDSLPLKLSALWKINVNQDDNLRRDSCTVGGSMNSEDSYLVSTEEEPWTSVDIEDKEKSSDIFISLKNLLLKAFKLMDRELRIQPSIDCFCSGTTAVTLLQQGQDIFIGNVGDSRAVLGTRDQNDALTAIQLTVDLKPNLPEEAERIRKCRGRIFALQDEPEVARVWLPYNNAPGLAMTRAFGDFCLKDFGLLSVPEVSYRHLTEKDEFVVLATDGVWDVLSNEEVVNIVAESSSRSLAAKTLVESAVRAWRSKYPTSKVDDCAAVCLFLDANTSTCSTNNSEVQSTTGDTNEGSGVNRETNTSSTEQDLSGNSGDIEECIYNPEDGSEEWLALEGVSRVNTLLTLPRLVAEQNRKVSKKV